MKFCKDCKHHQPHTVNHEYRAGRGLFGGFSTVIHQEMCLCENASPHPVHGGKTKPLEQRTNGRCGMDAMLFEPKTLDTEKV